MSATQKLHGTWRLLARAGFVLLALSCAACPGSSSDSPGDESGAGDTQPWTHQFTFGNFAINTAPVVTNQDGISEAYLADYVNEAALPDANFEIFSVNAYLPDSDSTAPRIENVKVTLQLAGGASLGDVYQSDEFVQHSTLDGQSYSVFRITGRHIDNAAPVTRANFANVAFELDAVYEQDGTPVHSAMRTIEVFKR